MIQRFIAALLCLATAFSQTSAQVPIAGGKPRPVMELLRQLETYFGWRISYEEPPYESPVDLVNVVSPQYLSSHPGATFLIPRPQLLGASIRDNGFIVSYDRDFAHVTPTQYRKKDGTMAPFASMLSTTVTLSPAQRTIRDAVNLVCTQVAAARGIPIAEGTIPTNLYHQIETTYADNEPASVVLTRIFGDADAERTNLGYAPLRITWDLLYDANEKSYFLNVHPILRFAY
jgi:hypothetical protein